MASEAWREAPLGGGGPPGDSDDLLAKLGPFCDSNFDARAYTKAHYKRHSDAQAKQFCESLLEQRSAASLSTQRRVFKNYPKFIESADDLRAMENDLVQLRRVLGKSEFVLSSLEAAASKLAKLDVFEARLDENKAARQARGERPELAIVARVSGEERAGLWASLEASRFKRSQAVLSSQEFGLKWLLEAPNRLGLLLHFDSFDRAVQLVRQVRSCNLSQQRAGGFEGDDATVSGYMLEERRWALHYAAREVELKATELVNLFVKMLENNQSVSSRHGGSATAGAATNMFRRRSGSVGESIKRQSKSGKLANHPVRFLQQLGKQDMACRAFLRGKHHLLKTATDEVIYGPLATDPEQCILELAQAVFKGILDTTLEFRALFVQDAGAKAAGEQDFAQDDAAVGRDGQGAFPLPGSGRAGGVMPDAQLSCLMVWTREQVARFIVNFVRFLIPGCLGLGAESRGRRLHQDSEQQGEMPNVPFMAEEHPQVTFVHLANDEWKVLGNCLRWTLLLCRRLEKYGITLSYIVARELKSPLHAALDSIFVQVEKSLRSELNNEVWRTEQLCVESGEATQQSVLSLTTCGQKMYELIHDMIRKVKRVYSTYYSTATSSLESNIVDRVESIFKAYLFNLVHAAGAWPVTLEGSRERFEEFVKSRARRGDNVNEVCEKLGQDIGFKERRVVAVLAGAQLSNSQLLGMIANALFVSTDLVVRVRGNFEKLFKRELPQLGEIATSLADLDNEDGPLRLVCDAFVTRNSDRLLEDVLQWSQLDYSSQTETGPVSSNFARVADDLAELKNTALQLLGNHSCALDLVVSITEQLLAKLSGEGVPSAIFGPVEGEENRQRLTADLHMLVNIPQTLMERDPHPGAIEVVQEILRLTGAAD